MGILSLISDPKMFIITLLITLPGVLMALSAHEAAHGYVALRCGDPTAKYMGRVTLNPLKHIDIVGFLCMIFVGFGWAKPVPVNPNNFRNYRKDDLRVSLAGITANLLMFLLAVMILFALFFIALARVPNFSISNYPSESVALCRSGNDYMVISGTHFYSISLLDLFESFSDIYVWEFDGVRHGVGELLITPAFGTIVNYIYIALSRFAMLNLMLAVFNLIPMPPLDGYHVLNDLILKRPLFAAAQAARVGMGILFGLIMLGNIAPDYDILGKLLSFIRTGVFDSIAKGVHAIYSLTI